jgi:hypothetical protein
MFISLVSQPDLGLSRRDREIMLFVVPAFFSGHSGAEPGKRKSRRKRAENRLAFAGGP